MAISFPLSLGSFYDKLSIVEASVYLPELLQHTRDQSGNLFVESLGDRLWMGRISLHRRNHAEVVAAEAILSLVRSDGASFYFCDPRVVGPRNDLAGSGLSGFTVTISAVAGNRRDLTLAGLPVGYVLSSGDRVSFTYTVSGTSRFAYHQITIGGVANGSGVVVVQVDPYVRDGFSPGATVTLLRARMKAVYLPNSYQPSSGRMAMSDGLSFSFQQVLA